MEPNKFTIVCPCCEAVLTLDAQTGTVLAHEEKKKPLATFEEMAKDLTRQKTARENIFAQEMNARETRLGEMCRSGASARPDRRPL